MTQASIITYNDPKNKIRRQSVKSRIYNLLFFSKKMFHYKGVALTLGISEQSASKRLSDLVKEGRAEVYGSRQVGKAWLSLYKYANLPPQQTYSEVVHDAVEKYCDESTKKSIFNYINKNKRR